MRYFLELSFDGTAYHGWQIQNNALTVQEVLNNALTTLLRKNIEVVGAGRTDTGVHAIMMMAHFDCQNKIKMLKDFIYHLNSLLPRDITVKQIMEVKAESHARFDAVSREYIYKIVRDKDPFLVNKAWLFPHFLDLKLMNKASEVLKSFEDFSCFSKSGTQTKTNLCNVVVAKWYKENETIIFKIKADRFLRNMVRAIVGTMIEIGKNDLDMKGFKKIILSGDRSMAGLSVPAHGLYLSAIEYPNKIFKE